MQQSKEDIIEQIHRWIINIDSQQEIPITIKAFNIGIIKSTSDYQIYLIGAEKYDPKDEDWSCVEDFVPNNKYLSLGLQTNYWEWQEILSIVKESLETFIQREASNKTFIHLAEYVTTGFDDGNLIIIHSKS